MSASWIGSEPFPDRVFLVLKRTGNLAAGAAGLLLTAVLGLPIALAIRLEGRGPVLYRQVRLGQFGREVRGVTTETRRHGAGGGTMHKR